MKRFFIALLILIMTLGIAQGALAADVPKTFDDIVVGGVTYYDLLDGTSSNFVGGVDGFYRQYLETPKGNHPSMVNQWKDVYQAILDDGNFSGYKFGVDNNQEADWQSETKTGFANSIEAAQNEIIAIINADPTGRISPRMVAVPNLNAKSQRVYYYCSWRHQPLNGTLFTSPTAGAYALIFSNFKIYQVANGEYIEKKIMADGSYDLNTTGEKKSYSLGFSNRTINDASASAALSTNVTESV
ncbi:MAG: hypothetical protein RR843_06570, partial [Clostridia bacterium]